MSQAILEILAVLLGQWDQETQLDPFDLGCHSDRLHQVFPLCLLDQLVQSDPTAPELQLAQCLQ